MYALTHSRAGLALMGKIRREVAHHAWGYQWFADLAMANRASSDRAFGNGALLSALDPWRSQSFSYLGTT